MFFTGESALGDLTERLAAHLTGPARGTCASLQHLRRGVFRWFDHRLKIKVSMQCFGCGSRCRGMVPRTSVPQFDCARRHNRCRLLSSRPLGVLLVKSGICWLNYKPRGVLRTMPGTRTWQAVPRGQEGTRLAAHDRGHSPRHPPALPAARCCWSLCEDQEVI